MKKWSLFLVLLTALFFAGCGQKDLGDEYIEGSDCQYMFDSNMNIEPVAARGQSGYFFLQETVSSGSFVYYLDDATGQLLPLCNKVDCLHDEETDADRLSECNAYFEEPEGLQYCDGYLYVLDTVLKNGVHQRLIRITEDGSVRDIVYEWDEEGIDDWIIHRNVMYFTEREYEVVENAKDEEDEEEVIETHYVKQLSLSQKGRKKPKVIYEEPEDVTVFSFSHLEAYGNYVYFYVLGDTTKDVSLVTDENYLDYFYGKMFVYSVQTGKLTEISSPDENSGGISSVTFFNGKLLFDMAPADHKMQSGVTTTVYTADLDGKSCEILWEDVPYGLYYYSDGKYLYVTNWALVARGFEDTQYFEVYDTDMNLVDTFTVPFSDGFINWIGEPEGMYFWTEHVKDASTQDTSGENAGGTKLKELGLQFFDKSAIGSLDGDAFSYTTVAKLVMPADDDDDEDD